MSTEVYSRPHLESFLERVSNVCRGRQVPESQLPHAEILGVLTNTWAGILREEPEVLLLSGDAWGGLAGVEYGLGVMYCS